ncbi:MAG: PAS domain-containing sensor histidine kinase [Methanoregula sp.]
MMAETPQIFYSELFDLGGEAIFLIDNETGAILEVNTAASEMYGYSRDLLLTMKNTDLSAESEDTQKFTTEISQGTIRVPLRYHRRNDGTVFPVEIIGRFFIRDGRPFHVAAIRDITEQKRVEEALRESHDRFEQISDQSREMVWEVDTEGLYTYVSHASYEILGFNPDELVGKKHFYDLHPNEGHEAFVASISEAIAKRSIFHDFLHALQTKTGQIVWMSTNGIPIYDDFHNFLGYRGSDSDITERKRAEEALQQANKKLTLLTSITRHDINNQLTGLQGYLSLIEEEQPDTANNEYFQKIATAAERISAMIRFTREYEAIGITSPAWQDTRKLVEMAANQASLGHVCVKNDLPDGTEVFADPLIFKVFYNLMDNAIRYGRKITTIRFSAEDRNGDRIIVCEDDGDGVVVADKQKIFDRGFGKNTGLGLALSREILDITGIRIHETGEPGKGARFEMIVPKDMWRTVAKGV